MRISIYPAYRFRHHDPILDALDTLRADAGFTVAKLAVSSHVSDTTLHNWVKRKTRRPQFASVMGAARACGAVGVKFDRDGHPYFVNGRKPPAATPRRRRR